jgi:hypothetical protein
MSDFTARLHLVKLLAGWIRRGSDTACDKAVIYCEWSSYLDKSVPLQEKMAACHAYCLG